MKNLMKVLSVLVLFCGIILVLGMIFDLGSDYTNFLSKIIIIIGYCFPSIITFAACSYCMERNDNNYFVRVFPLYALLPIILITILAFFEISEEWMIEILMFLIMTNNGIALISLAMIVKANNSISKIIKYIAIGAIVLCTIFDLIHMYDAGTLQTFASLALRLLLSGIGVNVSLYSSSYYDKIPDMIYSVSLLIEVFGLVLLYITNYAFSDSVQYDDIDIDYEAVKEDAIKASNMKMNEIYNSHKPKEEPTRVESNNSNMMNINNQLGQDSNVGTVSGQAKEVNVTGSALDSLIPLSNGPVINQTMNNNQTEPVQNNTQEAPVQQEQAVQQIEQQVQPQTEQQEQHLQPNMDIQEQMKLKMQNTVPNQQQNINNQ